jgi:hypothetical protein
MDIGRTPIKGEENRRPNDEWVVGSKAGNRGNAEKPAGS